ncbi:hypothetical protein M0R45_002737 [Rubus argutus]|uniref:Subtilisin-like protease fibronectin type-III domain-containing protein n=1 Tax=Rubus argutus TaxID=59490 RepID=A0AAW1VQR3_RUBAR
MTTADIEDNTQNPIRAHKNGTDYDFASPLDMGAGQINSNKAFDPGLIYAAAGQDYVNLLCSLNNCWHPILKCSTTSPCYTCSTPSSHLTYPSFIFLYGDATRSINRIFQRTTNVDQGPAIYKFQLTTPPSTLITVLPEILVYGKKYAKQSYTVTISQNGKENHACIYWFSSLGGTKC